MPYVEIIDPLHPHFEAGGPKEEGREPHEEYVNTRPFSETIVDGFLPASPFDLCLANFPQVPDPESASFEPTQERCKTSLTLDHLAAPVPSFFDSLNSRHFLENQTGIDGLIPGPFYVGRGLLPDDERGRPGVRTDFNPSLPPMLRRRFAVLVSVDRGSQAFVKIRSRWGRRT